MMIPHRKPHQSFDAHQAEIARWAGYPDADALNADHDDLHRAVCNWLGVTSHALRVAAGECMSLADRELAAMEEQAVMFLQRWMRHAGAEVPHAA